MSRAPFLLLPAALLAVAGSAGAAWAQGNGTYVAEPTAAPAGTYALDKLHSSVTMRIIHGGLSHFAMRFKTLDAKLVYDPKSPAAAKVEVTIDPASIETYNPKLNEEITGQFFEAGKYPAITFTSTKVTPAGAKRGKIAGELTLHGVTKPVILDVTYNGARLGMFGQDHIGFSAVTTVRRSDFAVAPKLPPPELGDEVAVTIEVEFKK